MGSVLHDIVRFLALSSVQLCALAAVALLALRVTRGSGQAACRTLAIVLSLPLLSLLAEQLPERPVKILPASFTNADGGVAGQPSSGGGTGRPEGPAEAPPMRASPGPPAPAPAAAPAATGRAPAPATPPHRRRVDFAAALGISWLLVLAVLTARIARRSASLRSLLRGAVPPTNRERALVETCLARAGPARRPRVLVSEACSVPFVTGLLRPCIVVPRRLSGERLELALLHELAHVRHRDHLWIVPEIILRTLYFFHPLMHRVLNRLHEEREHRCDRFVTRLTGRCAPYAEFLLDEVRRASGRPREHPALALRGGRTALARRIARILKGGEQDMTKHTLEQLASAAVALFLALILACGTTTAAAGDDEGAAAAPGKAALDHINASKTDTPGLYHVMPVFEKLTKVTVFKRGGPYGKEHEVVLAPGEGYSFDATTGSLKLKGPIDDEKQMIDVSGVRAMPWAWRAGEPLKQGSVRILLGEREGKRGVDFDVDEAKGLIRFLKADLCDRTKHYYISYAYPDDPRKPNEGRGGAIGNHPDQAAVRRFLGIDETPAAAGDLSKTIGTNASPTDDPRRWTIVQPLESESVQVAVLKRAEPGNLRWLDRSTDYVYDETATTIAFLKDIPIDKEAEMLFVRGVPRDRRVFFAHRLLKEGDVSVTVAGRALVEGTGFTVDYKTGKITVHDDAITKPGASFQIHTTGWSYGQTSGN